MMTKTDHSYDTLRGKLEYMKAVIDPQFLLETLGFKLTKTSRHELRSTCLIHGGDNKSAFRFNVKTKTWVCFSHNCHDNRNDIIGLIQAVKQCGFMDAFKFLDDLTGNVTEYTQQLTEFKVKKEKEAFIADFDDTAYKPSIVSDTCLNQFKPFRSTFFVEEGFSKETLDYFEIAGGYVDKMGLLRDIIPIRNDLGELVAYSFRDLRRHIKKYDDKYSLTPGFDKDKVLYNLNNIIPLLEQKPLILVEGFKSVWRLYEYGIYNVAAVIGSTVTQGQLNLLCTYAKKGCVILFDNDTPGIKGTVNSTKFILERLCPVIPVFITEIAEDGKGLDPADLSKQQVFKYLNGLF